MQRPILVPHEGVAAELSYADWPGNEPAIVLVPGIFSSQRSLAALARGALAGTARRRVRPARARPRPADRVRSGLAGTPATSGARSMRSVSRAPLLAGHSLGAFVGVGGRRGAARRRVGHRPARRRGLVASLRFRSSWCTRSSPTTGRASTRDSPTSRRTPPSRELEPRADVLHELSYELAPSGGIPTPVMPVGRSMRTSPRSPPTGEPAAVGGGLPGARDPRPRGIGGDPLAQMVDDATLEAARAEAPALRAVDIEDSTHGELVRPPYVQRVARDPGDPGVITASPTRRPERADAVRGKCRRVLGSRPARDDQDPRVRRRQAPARVTLRPGHTRFSFGPTGLPPRT